MVTNDGIWFQTERRDVSGSVWWLKSCSRKNVHLSKAGVSSGYTTLVTSKNVRYSAFPHSSFYFYMSISNIFL